MGMPKRRTPLAWILSRVNSPGAWAPAPMLELRVRAAVAASATQEAMDRLRVV